jgi:hypothetical protein
MQQVMKVTKFVGNGEDSFSKDELTYQQYIEEIKTILFSVEVCQDEARIFKTTMNDHDYVTSVVWGGEMSRGTKDFTEVDYNFEFCTNFI